MVMRIKMMTKNIFIKIDDDVNWIGWIQRIWKSLVWIWVTEEKDSDKNASNPKDSSKLKQVMTMPKAEVMMKLKKT